MKVVTAEHPSGQMKIVQRWIEGVRYLKVTPQTLVPMILEKLQQQFITKPVKVTASESGWIRIEKTGTDEQLENAAKKATGKSKITEDEVIEQEVTMLKQQGFIVKVTEE